MKNLLNDLLVELDRIGLSDLYEGGRHSVILLSKADAKELAEKLRDMQEKAWRYADLCK